MNAFIVTVRLIHVLSAIFWVGTAIFTTFFLFPALMASGRSAVPVMAALQKSGMVKAVPAAAGLTILSGVALIWQVSGGDVGAYSATSVGRGFTSAGGIAIVAFILGMALARPAGVKAGQLSREAMTMPEGPDRNAKQAEAAAVQKKGAMATMVVTVMLILAAAGMAMSRYL